MENRQVIKASSFGFIIKLFFSEALTSVKKRTGDTEETTFRAYLEQEWRRFSIDLVPKVTFLIFCIKAHLDDSIR